MTLNAKEFERRSEEFFSDSYLASLGVIQNVVLGLLAARIFIIESPTSLQWMQAAGTLMVIVLVVEEYHWWLLIVRRTPSFLDAVIPYALGATELAAASVVDNTNGQWFPTTTIVAFAGICAIGNARMYCTNEMFRECMWLRPMTLRKLYIGMAQVIVMGIIPFSTYLFWDRIPVDKRWICFFLFYALVISMIVVSARFLSRTRREFRRISESTPPF